MWFMTVISPISCELLNWFSKLFFQLPKGQSRRWRWPTSMILVCSTCSSLLKTWTPSVSPPTSLVVSNGIWNARLAQCLQRALFGVFATACALMTACLPSLLPNINAYFASSSYGMVPMVPPPSRICTSTTCPISKTISLRTTRGPRSNASFPSSLGVFRLFLSLPGLCSWFVNRCCVMQEFSPPFV